MNMKVAIYTKCGLTDVALADEIMEVKQKNCF